MTATNDDFARAAAAEQAARMRALWAAVAVEAVRDASKKMRNPREARGEEERFEAWLRGKHGRMVLSMAGIEPDERALGGIMRLLKEAGSSGLRFSSITARYSTVGADA